MAFFALTFAFESATAAWFATARRTKAAVCSVAACRTYGIRVARFPVALRTLPPLRAGRESPFLNSSRTKAGRFAAGSHVSCSLAQPSQRTR